LVIPSWAPILPPDTASVDDGSKEVMAMLDEREMEAKPDADKGLECPSCGDRFPSKETLEEHSKEAHQLAG
jgi:hypothetical protein